MSAPNTAGPIDRLTRALVDGQEEIHHAIARMRHAMRELAAHELALDRRELALKLREEAVTRAERARADRPTLGGLDHA